MSSRLIREVIGRRAVPAAKPTASAGDVARIMRKTCSSAVLVVDRHKLVGICTERDLIRGVMAPGLDPNHTQVCVVMQCAVQIIGPDRPFAHALHLMYEGGFRHVPVVDGAGHPVGLLASSDARDTDCLGFENDLIRREDIAAILG
ncbi:MAG: cyclic nucleotide-binding/CBS domain-containing protein [Ignavibacteria bacterium]